MQYNTAYEARNSDSDDAKVLIQGGYKERIDFRTE
jgi:hypothetical protein